MIHYKTKEEIDCIRESSLLVARTHGEIARHIRPGISTLELDQIAENFIRDHSAVPAFKGYQGFPYSLCISPNEVVVHGFPGTRILKEGDIVSIDCGVLMNGYYGDSAYTYAIGEISPEKKRLLEITHRCLMTGIEHLKIGNTLGDVSWSVQKVAEDAGYSVVRELVGHGVGKNLHEPPELPNYGKKGSGEKIREGLVVAIEPMINMGKRFVVQGKDGWTIRTVDGKPSGHYEHTVAVIKGKAEPLSSFAFIEEALEKNTNNTIIIR